MCGGTGYSRPSPPPKPGWRTFWNTLKMPSEDTGIFVEVVQGCDSISCKYQCQARGMAKSRMSFDELAMICHFLEIVETPSIMFFGMGDPGDFDWLGFRKEKPKAAMPPGRINISPTTDEEVITAIARQGLRIYFTVNTPEEAVLANMKQRLLGCRLPGALVSVARNVNWLEIAKTITLPIEFNSFTPSWSPLFVSAKEFNDSFMSLGISLEAEEYKLKSGFKPVIERCSIGKKSYVLRFRRCFQLDSKAMTIEIPIKQDLNIWERDNPRVYKKLDRFAKSKTSCDKCSKVAWYYNFRR